MSVSRLKLVILITLLVAQLAMPLATASSRPEWARDGVYFIYGVVGLEDEVASREELESAINRWRFAGIRDYDFIIEIKFISVSELGVNYMATYYSYTHTISPSPPETANCPWDRGGCAKAYGPFIIPFYISLEALQKQPVGTNESCYDSNCTIVTTNLSTINIMTRLGTLELYEYIYKFENVYKYANGTIERRGEYTYRYWIHKFTGIVIEAFFPTLKLGECPPDRRCWTAGLVLLLDTNVPLGAKPPAPTQTTPQVSPIPAQTPVTPTTTPATPYTPTPTQVETVKTTSPTTPAQQPVAPDQLPGMVLPVVVAVLAVGAVVVVLKVLRK